MGSSWRPDDPERVQSSCAEARPRAVMHERTGSDRMTRTIGLLLGIFSVVLMSWVLVNGIVLLWLNSGVR